MSRVWCTSLAALLLAGSYGAGGAVAAPGSESLSREPVPARAAATVRVSPELVPPEAPVGVEVSAPAFGGGAAEIQVRVNDAWVAAARVTLDARGRGTARVTRRAAGRYDVRAVVDAAPEVVAGGAAAVASAPRRFEVTTTGLGDPAAYRYVSTRRGIPPRWNPCAVVTYRVNTSAARPSALGDLREALRRVSYETGIRFRELGATAQVPGTPGFRYEADLVVAWTQRERSTLLGGDRAAAGGYELPVPGRGGRPRIERGFVVVDAERVRDLDPGYGAGVTEGQVLLHELGHVLALDHVDAEYQMLRPRLEFAKTATLYGAGDLTGLRRIGRRAGCV